MKIDTHNNLIEFGTILLIDHIVIDIQGDDKKVEEFLQGQVTSDVSLLSDNTSQLSCICNHKGEILADFIIIKKNKKYKFIVESNSGLDIILIDELTPFAKFSNVELKKTNEMVVGTISPKSNSNQPFLSNNYFELSISTGINLNKDENSICALQWEAANKILGNLVLEKEDTAKYRPLEINYDKLRVSFDKGCYRGQEIVARMKYLGIDRRKFCTLITEISFFNQFEGWIQVDSETGRVSIDPDTAPNKKSRLFKNIGKVINFNSTLVFNVIVKKDDLSMLKDRFSNILEII